MRLILCEEDFMASPAYSPADYRKLAQEALLYVQGRVTVGSGNKLSDLLSSLGDSFICVAAGRSVTNEYSTANMERFLRLVAGAAEANGCGNCGELSAMAFVYLMDKGVLPLDWMRLQKPGDHMFVVLGRSEGSDDKNPTTWGTAAIVCDPWKGEVYTPDMIMSKWHYLPESRFRLSAPAGS
jgi:hypothetical protein